MKNLCRRLAAFILTVVVALSLFPTSAQAMPLLDVPESFEEMNPSFDRESVELDILTSTLGDSVGMQGFEGANALSSDPGEIVEIVVQFKTPPAVALRLMRENGIPHVRGRMAATAATYEEQALEAHAAFEAQLWDDVMIPFGAEPPFEIFESNHRLFNGVHIRVPTYMVETIAGLPEVFRITPYILPVLWESPDVSGFVAPRSHATDSPFFLNPNLLRASRDMFQIDYIHNTLGITGDGVRVAMLDTGIDSAHPEFVRFLDGTGRVRGWEYHVAAGLPYMDASNHGTMTAGAIIAMAPEIEMWSFRKAHSDWSGFSHYDGFEAITALELAHAVGADIIYTWGGGTDPFTPHDAAVTLAVLDGVVVVAAAHNYGPGASTVRSPGNSPLAITVGAGTAGSEWGTSEDTIADFSGRGPVRITYHIKPDIIAPGISVLSTDVGGGYGYFSGTSAASPIITGIAALLVQEFPNAEPWEIKARMMNNARPLADLTPNSVFTVGAGFVQPLEALTNSTVITAEHYVPLTADPNAPFAPAVMSSMSFGLFDLYYHNSISVTMPMRIENRGNTTRTYTVSYTFTSNPNDRASLIFGNTNVTVDAGGMGQTDITLSLGEGAPPGFYEGYIYVRDGEIVVARLPFGARVITETMYMIGTVGEGGAPWRLYRDGTLVVDSGLIDSGSRHGPMNRSPWYQHNHLINRIIFTGEITGGQNMVGIFNGLTYVTEIEGLHYFDTEAVITMEGMFHSTWSLQNLDGISGWNTSNVIDMRWMFSSEWLVEGVGSLTSLDLSGWDTSSVMEMTSMFSGATGLTSVNLSGWDTSNVMDMHAMFSGTSSLTDLEGISDWDIGNVRDISMMFRDASSLTSLDLSGWNTGNVQNMNGMFIGASSLTYLDISGWDTGSIWMSYDGLSAMFDGASSLTSLDLSEWDTSGVRNMVRVFRGASSLTSLDLSGWDTGEVTNMFDMFDGLNNLRQLSLGEYFQFVVHDWGDAALPAASANYPYTGFWQNVYTGTETQPQGKFILSSTDLMSQFNGSIMADTWVWSNEKPTLFSPIITVFNAPDEIIGVGYSFQFRSLGNPPPEWSSVGNLPPGLTLSSTGVLSGTPSQTGEFAFTVIATNEDGSDTRQITVTIMDSPFTDPNFLSAIREITGIAEPQPIGLSDVATIEALFVPNRGIINLDGIQHFTALRHLDAAGNKLVDLDVSNNRDLTTLYVGDNFLTKLDVSNNRRLGDLHVMRNQLTELDVSNTLSLNRLWAFNNFMTTPDDVIGWRNWFADFNEMSPFLFFPQHIPTVTAVTVAPITSTVQRGETQQFTVTVEFNWGGDGLEAVVWSVSGNYSAGTTITAEGLLTVAQYETARSLTITASSTYAPRAVGTATVAITGALPIVPEAITGVISPVATQAPSMDIDGGTGFAAVLTWDNNPPTFGLSTAYTATITLTVDGNYIFPTTLNSTASIAGFTVNSHAPVWVSRSNNELVFTVTFPETGAQPPIDIVPTAISGVTSPVATQTPSTAINGGTGFTAVLTWDNNPSTFGYATAYTARITLTVDGNYIFPTTLNSTASIAGFTVNSHAPVWVSRSNNELVFTVTFPETGAQPTRSISLTSGTMTFPAQTVGYTQPAAQSTVITNTGNQATGQLTVAAPTGFQVSRSQTTGFAASITVSSIAVDDTATFWTRPTAGLAAGTHTGNVIVANATPQTPLLAQTRFVSFTVNPVSQEPPPTISFPGVTQPPIPLAAIPFDDVNAGNWFAAPIAWAYANGITDGVRGTNNFDPRGSVTRAHFVTFLHRVLGTPAAESGARTFDDVRPERWYTDAVEWASSVGIAQGSGVRFRPGYSVTRQEMALFLHRFANHVGADTTASADTFNTFPDRGDEADWARTAIIWATHNEIITGRGIYDPPRLLPEGRATRAEALAIIHRFVGLVT